MPPAGKEDFKADTNRERAEAEELGCLPQAVLALVAVRIVEVDKEETPTTLEAQVELVLVMVERVEKGRLVEGLLSLGALEGQEFVEPEPEHMEDVVLMVAWCLSGNSFSEEY